jgi:hypothetical protein
MKNENGVFGAKEILIVILLPGNILKEAGIIMHPGVEALCHLMKQ